MHGKERRSGAGARSGTSPAALLWRLRLRAAGVSLAAVVFGSLYFFVRQAIKDGIWRFDFYLFNKSLAVASLFLLALSMLLTSIHFLSRRPRRALAYRKHYGLAGFWTGAAHGLASHVFLPEKFPLPGWIIRHPAEAGLGLAALALFAGMAVLSLATVKGRLGGTRWRRFLRFGGYAALILAAVHAGALKWASWTKYLGSFESVLPSLSLPVVLFAAASVILRLAVGAAARVQLSGKITAGAHEVFAAAEKSDEGQKLEDRRQAVGDEHPDELEADYEQKDPVKLTEDR